MKPEQREIQKTYAAKAEAGTAKGEFTAIVSAFGNVDSQGDIVDEGAFAGSIDKYASGDAVMPVIFSHQWNDLNAWLGKYDDMEEVKGVGLKLHGLLDVEDSASSKRAHQLMKDGTLREFSFGGRVTKHEVVRVPDEDAMDGERVEYHLKEIDLWEAGPTFKGANSETQLLSVKSLDSLVSLRETIATKEGRVLAQKHTDALRSAHQTLGEVLDAVSPKDDSGKSITPEADDVVKTMTLSPSVQALLVLSQIDYTERATS